jgi:chromosomal replication initiation ATPase DnaA
MMGRMICKYLVEAAALECGVSVAEIVGRNRRAKSVYPRRLIYFATPEIGISISEMARYLDRDHSTISKTIHLKRITEAERRKIEAIKLTAQMLANQHQRRLKDAFSMGVAA